MEILILARHGHALSNATDVTSSTPPGLGLTENGIAQARALRESLAGTDVRLGVSSRFLRARQTLDLAVEARGVPTLAVGELDEIGFGDFDGRSVDDYRGWAWTAPADAVCPGGGESRAAVAARTARALGLLLDRAEQTIVVVGHALPLRYVLDAARGLVPAARIEPLGHAAPMPLRREEVADARSLLEEWAAAARFRE